MQRSCPSGGGLDQTVEGDRELANADPGRVPHRVGDRAGRSGDPDLADALDAERVDVGVVLFDENGFERGDVRVHRHMVLAEIWVHRAAGAWVHDGMLMQSERYAPNHTAVVLAAHQPRIDDPAGREGADETGGADLPQLGVDFDLGENCPVRMHGVA